MTRSIKPSSDSPPTYKSGTSNEMVDNFQWALIAFHLSTSGRCLLFSPFDTLSSNSVSPRRQILRFSCSTISSAPEESGLLFPYASPLHLPLGALPVTATHPIISAKYIVRWGTGGGFGSRFCALVLERLPTWARYLLPGRVCR